MFGIQARGGCACAGPYAEVGRDSWCIDYRQFMIIPLIFMYPVDLKYLDCHCFFSEKEFFSYSFSFIILIGDKADECMT